MNEKTLELYLAIKNLVKVVESVEQIVSKEKISLKFTSDDYEVNLYKMSDGLYRLDVKLVQKQKL